MRLPQRIAEIDQLLQGYRDGTLHYDVIRVCQLRLLRSRLLALKHSRLQA